MEENKKEFSVTDHIEELSKLGLAKKNPNTNRIIISLEGINHLKQKETGKMNSSKVEKKENPGLVINNENFGKGSRDIILKQFLFYQNIIENQRKELKRKDEIIRLKNLEIKKAHQKTMTILDRIVQKKGKHCKTNSFTQWFYKEGKKNE